MMDDFGFGHEHDLPASLTRAHAPIKVFAMEEISFIERPYIRDRLSAHHHAGAGNRLDLDGVVRKRIAMPLFCRQQRADWSI